MGSAIMTARQSLENINIERVTHQVAAWKGEFTLCLIEYTDSAIVPILLSLSSIRWHG